MYVLLTYIFLETDKNAVYIMFSLKTDTIIQTMTLKMSLSTTEITCLVRGASSTGKTELIRRLSSGLPIRDTPFVVGCITFATTPDRIRFTAIECLDTDESLSKVLQFYPRIDCIILMTDVLNPETLHNLKKMKEDCQDIPAVICLNNYNIRAFYVLDPEQYKPFQVCPINSRTDYNLAEPFLMLARKVLKNPDIELGTIEV